MKSNMEIKSVEIFNGAIWQAQMVKNLLENAGIEAFLQDEVIGSLNFPWASSGGAGVVKLMISNVDYEKALPIVEEYENNLEEEQ